ncbi:MAG: polyhydroxyalkanoate synthesis repressor PhaR [Pseudomonadota bacterium]
MAKTSTAGPTTRGRAAGQDGKVVIKKYANRRLYNTAKSSYVTLDDLARMVREGEDFGVYDAKSGEEITRSVLTQIIVEEEGKDQNMLPTNFLRELIRLYGDPLQGVVPSYLDAAMDAFNRNQENMRKTFGAGAAISNLEQMTRANMDFFQKSMQMFAPFQQEGMRPEPEPVAEARDKDLGQDIEALQAQLREMQAQLSKLSN